MLKKRTPKKVDFISITEASELWEVSKQSIRWQYYRSQLFMRRSGKVWMVYVKDMYRRFGKPKKEIVVEKE